MTAVRLWAERAWLPGGWQRHVLLETEGGRWRTVAHGVRPAPAGATVVAGPLLPAVVSAHSHAFQRACAGLAERREAAADDFWSWRERMYQVALRITPEALRAIAAQLYVELLRGGYTQVCEFHYLQHDRDGRAYADPLALSWALAEAAADAGIGLTLLPVLYERAGFAQPGLRADQRRFRLTAAQVWDAQRRIAASGRALVGAGVAIHSLRAAAPASMHALRALAQDSDLPIHIHVAEQAAEVDDCVAASGVRPLEWLARERLLDARWQLVHATHATAGEIAAVAASGAGVVLCPSTEANLGDGLADLPGWLGAGVPLAIGSDSQVTRDWREELRWLDYGQRLALRRRNVGADPMAGQASTAQRLLACVVDAGARACGEPLWGLAPGARADALVAAPRAEALLGVPDEHWLDALVYSSPAAPWADVMVAGRWLLRGGAHAGAEAIARRFETAMAQLWPQP